MRKTLSPLVALCILCVFLAAAPASAQGPSTTGVLFDSFWVFLVDGQVSPEGVCFVQEDCDAGGSVQCSGTTCSAAQEWVECDGQRTYCPCQASVTCYGGTTISCTGSGGSRPGICIEGTYTVNCDESITYCPVTCTAECLDGLTQCVGYTGPYACFGKANLYITCDGRQYFCTDPVF
jgi:hypothetical protein